MRRERISLCARSTTSRTTSFMSTGWSAVAFLPQQGAQMIDDRAGPLVALDDVIERGSKLRDIQRITIQEVSSRLRVERTAVSGWLNSCASAPVSSPSMAIRLRCVSSRLCESVSSSARLRSVISLTMLRILSPSQRTMHAS